MDWMIRKDYRLHNLEPILKFCVHSKMYDLECIFRFGNTFWNHLAFGRDIARTRGGVSQGEARQTLTMSVHRRDQKKVTTDIGDPKTLGR